MTASIIAFSRIMLSSAVLICSLLFCMPAWAVGEPLKKATLIPLWSPQAQFAGYYTALDKGIYRKHGIDLTIITGGPERNASSYLSSGKADFAVLWLTTAVKKRISGVKLVNLAQIVQHSSMMLISRKSDGIKTPQNLNNKKVSLWGGDFSIPPHAFFKKYGLKVREIQQSYSVNLFLRGGIQAASAMWYNEYHTIINSGLNPDELTTFHFKEHGLDLPEDGLYTLESTLKRDPAMAEAFRKASLEGWEYAFAHPDEALDIVIRHMQQARVPTSRMHQKWMLERMRDLIMPPSGQRLSGQLDKSSYESAGRILHQLGIIRSMPEFSAFTGRRHAGQ